MLLSFIVVVGCRSTPQQDSSGAGNQLAFRQQIEADLVIDFLDWENLRIAKPPSNVDRYRGSLNKERLVQAIDDLLALRKHLVVVVMDKGWSVAGNRVGLDEIESLFRETGFQRVVIQQAQGSLIGQTGLPILRDSAEKR